MQSEISEIKRDNEAIHRKNEAIKGDNEAIHRDNEAIKRENEALLSENEALLADNTKLRELLDGHNKRPMILEGDLATSDNINKDILKIHEADSQIFTNISSYYKGGCYISITLSAMHIQRLYIWYKSIDLLTTKYIHI